ncbi:hypothetical protein GCM10027277_55990 [Pseudoduganella ginsengisoli]|nr:non-ribosomal peptide synthetase [Pseudoduganella ginsengisoli]
MLSTGVNQVLENALALSSVQQVVWIDQLLHPQAPLYNIGIAWQIRGPLDAALLERAINAVANANDALRLVLAPNGQPRQRILPRADMTVAVIDFAGEPDAEQRAHAYMQQHMQQPFDLSAGLLWEAQLVRTGAECHYWLQRYHHLVTDGFGIANIVHAVAGAYNRLLADAGAHIEAGPSYLDFIADDAAYQASARYARDRDFWCERYTQLPEPLFKRKGFAAPGQVAPAGQVRWAIPRTQYEQFVACATQHGYTITHLLMAAISACFSRLCGTDDIVIGMPVHNRGSAAHKRTIGMFSSVSPIGVKVRQDGSFLALLADVAAEMKRCYRHQRFPIAELNRCLNLNHSGRKQLFDITLSSMSFNGDNVFGTSPTRVVPIDNGYEHAALAIVLRDHHAGDDVMLDFNYNSDVFDHVEAQAIQRRMALLLEAAVRDPHQAIYRLPLMDEAERHQVLYGFNDTAMPYPRELLMHQLFEQQAAATPMACALRHGADSISYAELNARANRLARHLQQLQQRHLQPDARIAVCMERGIDMVVALFAILKAGAAYVPLDPGYPAERLAYMLADSAPAAVLAQRGTQAQVGSGMHVIEVDGEAQPWAALDDANLPAVAQATSLAYVIYTSGSTGLPKGVMLTHRNGVNFIAWALSAFTAQQLERTLWATSLNFDLHVYECYVPLSCGATITIVDNALALLRTETDATLLNTVPSAIEALANAGAIPATARTINMAGEALKRSLVEKLFATTAADTVCNLYGPSETTTYSTWTAMNRATGYVPHIGRPIANTTVYVLDAQLQPAPVGVAGELYIGGDGVARGYLNRPELTAERFVADPFVDGAVMYKTGDLGRWLADGNIEYLGRNDFQVKIRGFRVEPGEIEARLAACAGVREALVIAREDQPGGQRLVAYVLAHDGVELSPAGLRDALAATLADYMVPSAFVVLDAFPLTPNGKLDRKALPAPDADAVIVRAYEAPAGEQEQALAAIWCALLGIEQAGRHDHFFDLGGNSLLAVQLASQVRARLGVELALRDIFAAPTLAGMAAALAAASHAAPAAITPVARDGALPLSFSQQRLWFLDRLDHSASVAYHMPAAMRLAGPLDKAALQAALDRVVDRHESLRTVFTDADGEPVQSITPPGCGFTLLEKDLSQFAGHEQQFAVMQACTDEASQPFDLAAGPLMRGQLLYLAPNQHVLLLTKHHIISDGWSTAILVREISTLYAAFRAGQDDPLAPLALHYADYAAWQRRWLQGGVLAQHSAFWKDYLSGAPELLELPADRPRPARQSYAGATLPLALPAALSDALRALSQRHGVTLFMTMLAAWSALLARLSGQHDIVVGVPVANRQRAELEPLIGFFVNTLALRVQLDDDPAAGDLLARVKASALQAMSHQDLPFEQVVEAVSPSRSMRHSPVFQVMLNMTDMAGAQALSLPGVEIEHISQGGDTAQVDLSLTLHDGGGAIHGELRYATALFDAATIARMAGYFERILAGMAADDRQAVSRIALLDAGQRNELLVQFNDNAAPYPKDRLIHALFEEQAAARPGATALVFEDRHVSYAQLNARANAIAQHLLELGIQPDDRVALCALRGIGLIAAMLGILKAGGAYVPLDPDYPAERMAFMLADCTPAAVLAERDLAHKLPALSMPLLLLDHARYDEAHHANPVLPQLTARHLAYVIYTSGSTGNPKGVMVEHHNVLQLVINEPCVQISTDDCLAYCANPAFDASTWEIWLALLNGAKLLVIPHAVLLDPHAFGALLEQQSATILQLTVGLFNQYATPMAAQFRRLNYLLFGGDQPSLATVARVQAHSAPRHLVHTYGPTETTTFTATLEIDGTIQSAHTLPIGRPIANTRLYVLDRHLQPAPLGVAGEIYIGGAGVARGYLNRAELTAERFIADPFSAEPGARLYKTGDQGRWLANGCVEFLGRNDFQVKIRGFRIELGEIESRLVECDGVRDAVVLARQDQPGDKRLVAYLLADEGVTLSAAALRSALSASLAEFMIPSAFVTLDAYPLTANGKLDRRALPAPDGAALAARIYEAPQDDNEEAIAAIWQELLGAERVGRNDHFFELGGHSLMAVQLAARIQQRCHVAVPLKDLFDVPVLADLAQRVTALQFAEFMDDDLQAMQDELGAMSEEELRALLARESAADEPL